MREGAVDLAVIGSGPGGYAAALAAARRGLSVALVERDRVGGVCLNVGCIPTKALLSVSHLVRRIRHAEAMGIRVEGAAVDYPAVVARSQRIVTTLRDGLTELVRREGVELVEGTAAFVTPHQLEITRGGSGTQPLHAQRIVIATGARPVPGPWAFDEERILSYRGLLALKMQPASLLIIGGGVIGCEFASVFSTFGSRVTIIEQQPQLLPAEEPDAVRLLMRRFQADGVTVVTGSTVAKLEKSDHGVCAILADGTRHEADYCLIAIGQRPNLDALHLSAADIAHGRGVQVDAFLRTSQPHIAAIGDCIEGHGLAHWASTEGALAVRNLLGEPPASLEPSAVPRTIFTDPEIAHIGPLESTLGDSVRVSRFNFAALGKSHCDEETEGFVKLLVDPSTDRIRSATMVHANASNLIHYAVLAYHHGLTARQLAATITAHPTMPEAITEAAAHLYGESIMVASRRSRTPVTHA